MAPVQPGDQLSTTEAAAIVGVTDETMRRWAERRQVRHIKLPSGQLRFLRSDIEALLTPVEPEAS